MVQNIEQIFDKGCEVDTCDDLPGMNRVCSSGVVYCVRQIVRKCNHTTWQCSQNRAIVVCCPMARIYEYAMVRVPPVRAVIYQLPLSGRVGIQESLWRISDAVYVVQSKRNH